MKKLKWVGSHRLRYQSLPWFCNIYAGLNPREWRLYIGHNTIAIDRFSTLKEAKAAAQELYNQQNNE